MLVDVATWLGPKIDPSALDAELNGHGADGWELISAFDVNRGHGHTSAIVALFKRPR